MSAGALHENLIGMLGHDLVMVAGSFELDGTNDPTNKAGFGFDVTRNAQGVFDITLDHKYRELVCFLPGVENASAVGYAVEAVSYTASTGVLQVRVVNQDGTPATIASDPDGPRVNFLAVFQKIDMFKQRS